MDATPETARPSHVAPPQPAVQEPETTEDLPEKLQRAPMFMLAGTHALNDSYTAFLSPLLPLLMDRFGLSYALAGVLQSALSISTSLAQPLFGWLADRSKRVLFIILSPAITAIAISSMGLMPSYGWLFPALIVGGLSTAAFHPQATSVVPLVGGPRRGLAMALFIAGGTVGYSLGPAYILTIVRQWGLAMTWVAAIPALILVAILFPRIPKTAEGFAKKAVARASSSAFLKHWKPLLLMWFIVVFRSTVATTFSGFLPTYLRDVRGFDSVGFPLMVALLLYTATGAVGGLFAGYLSDVASRRTVITIGLLLTVPVLYGLLHIGSWWLWPLLMLSGGLLQATNPVLVIMAQELVPGSGGTAAGVMMGLGWAGGAGLVPIVGVLADRFGLATAMSLSLLLLLVAVALAAFIPEPRKRRVHVKA